MAKAVGVKGTSVPIGRVGDNACVSPVYGEAFVIQAILNSQTRFLLHLYFSCYLSCSFNLLTLHVLVLMILKHSTSWGLSFFICEMKVCYIMLKVCSSK